MPSYRLFFLLERREKDQDSMAKQLTAHAFLLDAKEKKTSESKKKCGGGEVKSPEKHLAKHLEKHLETQLLMLCPGRDFLGNRGREGELPIRISTPLSRLFAVSVNIMISHNPLTKLSTNFRVIFCVSFCCEV